MFIRMNPELKPPPGYYNVTPSQLPKFSVGQMCLPPANMKFVVPDTSSPPPACPPIVDSGSHGKESEIYSLRRVLGSCQKDLENSKEDSTRYRTKLEDLLKEFLVYKHQAEEQYRAYTCHISELTRKNIELEEELHQTKVIAEVQQTKIVSVACPFEPKDDYRDGCTMILENAVMLKDRLIRELESAMNYGYTQLRQLETHWAFDAKCEANIQTMFQNSTNTTHTYPNEISNYVDSCFTCLKEQVIAVRVEMEKRKRRYSMLLTDSCKRCPPNVEDKKKYDQTERYSQDVTTAVMARTNFTSSQLAAENNISKVLFETSRKCKILYKENMKLQQWVHTVADMVMVANTEKFEVAAEYKRHLKLLYTTMKNTPDQLELSHPDVKKVQEINDKLDLAEQIIRLFSTEVELWRGQYAAAMHHMFMMKLTIGENCDSSRRSRKPDAYSTTTNKEFEKDREEMIRWHNTSKCHHQMLQETVGRQKVELQSLKTSLRVKEAAMVGAECARDYYKKLAEEYGATTIPDPKDELKNNWTPHTPILDHILEGDYCYRKDRVLPSLSPQVAEVFKKAKAEWNSIIGHLPPMPPPTIPMPPKIVDDFKQTTAHRRRRSAARSPVKSSPRMLRTGSSDRNQEKRKQTGSK